MFFNDYAANIQQKTENSKCFGQKVSFGMKNTIN